METSIQSVSFDASTSPQYIPSNITTTGVRFLGIIMNQDLSNVTANSIVFEDNKSGTTLFTFDRTPTNTKSPSGLVKIILPSNGIRSSGGIKVSWGASDDFNSLTVLYQG